MDPTSAHGLSQSESESRVFGSVDEDALSGAEDSLGSLRRIMTESSAEEDGVLFDNSDALVTFENSAPEQHSSESGPRLRRLRTRSTIATVSDETTESASRDEDHSYSIHSTTNGAHFSEPTLALHMQMSLHPMTLADFLAPPTIMGFEGEVVPPLQHCFHSQPSINILLAILEGLDYLHNEGIVVRTL